MTHYFLDDTEFTEQLTQPTGLNEVLAFLNNSTGRQDLYVGEILLDGEPIELSSFTADDYTADILASVNELRIVTMQPPQLAQATITDFLDYLESVQEPLDELVEQCREQAEVNILEQIRQLTDGFQEMLKFLELAQEIGSFSLDSIKVEGTSLPTLVGELASILHELAICMQDEDMLQVADLVEYEIKKKVEQFCEVLYQVHGALD